MKYILITVIWTKALGAPVEFDDQKACESAGKQMSDRYTGSRGIESMYFKWFCFPKSSVTK